MVDVWLVELEAAEPALESEERRRPRLTQDDLKSISKLGHADLRRQKRLTTIALRAVIAAHTGSDHLACAPFDHLPGGKPVLPGASVSFSVSHAAGRALVGLSSKTKVGVDLEREHKLRMPPARQAALIEAADALPIVYRSDQPQDPQNDQPANELASSQVLRAWVRLEALAKFDGIGMGRLLTAAGVFGRHYNDDDERDTGRHPQSKPLDWPGAIMEPGNAILDLPVPADSAGTPWYGALVANLALLQQKNIDVRLLPIEPSDLARLTT